MRIERRKRGREERGRKEVQKKITQIYLDQIERERDENYAETEKGGKGGRDGAQRERGGWGAGRGVGERGAGECHLP